MISIRSLRKLFALPYLSSHPWSCLLGTDLSLLNCFRFWGKAFHVSLISFHPLLIGGKFESAPNGVGTMLRRKQKDLLPQLDFQDTEGLIEVHGGGGDRAGQA